MTVTPIYFVVEIDEIIHFSEEVFSCLFTLLVVAESDFVRDEIVIGLGVLL